LSKLLWAHISLFAVNLIYALNYNIAKGLMPEVIGPSGFIVLRLTGGFLLFLLLLSFYYEPVKKQHILLLALCGFLGAAANQLLFFNGLNLTSPLNSSIIMTSAPIAVLVASWFILKEPFKWSKGIGVLLGMAGAVTIILDSSGSLQSTPSNPLGDSFILLNAIAFALFLVKVKPLLKIYRAITVMTWVFFFGLIFSIPFGAKQLLLVQWSAITQNQWIAIVFVIVFTTFIAYLLNLWALKFVSPAESAVYIYLQPVLTFILSLLAARLLTPDKFYDPITLHKALGSTLIFSGVFLVSIKRR
jgi:drug/metabolite transporter (DMT)-like permease